MPINWPFLMSHEIKVSLLMWIMNCWQIEIVLLNLLLLIAKQKRTEPRLNNCSKVSFVIFLFLDFVKMMNNWTMFFIIILSIIVIKRFIICFILTDALFLVFNLGIPQGWPYVMYRRGVMYQSGVTPGATMSRSWRQKYFFEPADWLRNQLTSLWLNRNSN